MNSQTLFGEGVVDETDHNTPELPVPLQFLRHEQTCPSGTYHQGSPAVYRCLAKPEIVDSAEPAPEEHPETAGEERGHNADLESRGARQEDQGESTASEEKDQTCG